MPKRKKKGKGRGGVIPGVLGGALSMLALISATALLLHKNNELAEYIDEAVIAINIISSVICGAVAACGKESKSLINGALAGAAYFAMLLLLAACINADNIKLGFVCVMGTIALVGSAAGAMLNLCKSNKRLRNKAGR